MDANEALSIGLVDRVVAPDAVYDEALALAKQLAAGPGVALRAAKNAINRGLDVDLATGLEIERMQFAQLFATEDQKNGMDSFVENGPGKATFEGADMTLTTDDSDISADTLAKAFDDPRLANVLYHDWEASTYDEKWSISYDERCISYARDRFVHVAGTQDWPYERSLEIGCGTGFFTLNLQQAGVMKSAAVTDISPGMVEVAQRNARGLGFEVEDGSRTLSGFRTRMANSTL